MCFGSVGTDTGGSIRIPAAACGIVGLKPTLGELPCDGVVPLSTTLDHVGPLARSVADASLLFQAMKSLERSRHRAGRRRADLRRAAPVFLRSARPGVRAVRRPRHRAGHRRRLHASATSTIAGAECTPDVYLHICLPEASCYHAATLAEHADRYSPGVRLRLEMGRYILAEDYVRAMRLRARPDRRRRSGARGLRRAAAADAADSGADDRRRRRSTSTASKRRSARRCCSRTQLFNITGHPAIALPAGRGRRGCRAASRSSDIAAGPSGCSTSRRRSKSIIH